MANVGPSELKPFLGSMEVSGGSNISQLIFFGSEMFRVSLESYMWPILPMLGRRGCPFYSGCVVSSTILGFHGGFWGF